MVSRVRDLRPTRRGVAVVVVVGLAFGLGATTGARSLNAVVVPGLVALVAGAGQLLRAEAPDVERSTPEPGFPGEFRRVGVEVDSAVPTTISETVEDGVSVVEGSSPPTGSVGHGGTFEYEIELLERGAHRIGSATCRCTDSLGLFRTDVASNGSTTSLVYPRVYRIDGDELTSLVRRVVGNERSSFDRLREFAPGDSMRDIHWRASAKRPRDEFLVAEYRSHAESTPVSIVGESTPETADAVASTVASIATYLHDAGVGVSVTVPDGTCVAPPGDAASLLRLLALTDGGRVDEEARTEADVRVLGEGERTRVALADCDVEFERLTGRRRSGGVVG